MGGWDLFLIRMTIGLLAGLGLLSIYGTVYSLFASRADRQWTQTFAFLEYIDRMNTLAFPLVAGLLLVMTLCIPKRIVPRHILLRLSPVIVVVAAGLGAAKGAVAALVFLMTVAIVLQTAVAAFVLLRPAGLRFERQGRVAQLGSAWLHLGFVIFVFDLIVFYDSPWHIPVFWLATILMMGGMTLSFYAREIGAWLGRRPGRAGG